MSALEVNIDTFDSLVILPQALKISIPKILEPIITSVATEFDQSELVLTKIEAEDENMKIAGRYGVRGFPTVIAFIDGEEVDRFHSAQTPDFVRNFIDNNLAKII